MRRIVLSALLCAFVPASTARGALLNGSFEPAAGGFALREPHAGSADIPGWSVTGAGVEWISPEAYGFVAPHGAYVVDLAVETHAAGGLQQAFATEPGRTYRVTFWLGSQSGSGADGSARVLVAAAGRRETFAIHNRAPEVLWQAQTFRFIAREATTTLGFSCSQDARRHFAFLDGVSVVEAPEH